MTDKWHVGQRVGVNLFKHQCHLCPPCKIGNDIRHCQSKEMAGLSHDGGMAEYILGDPETLVELPDEVAFDQAAPLMCAGVSSAFPKSSQDQQTNSKQGHSLGCDRRDRSTSRSTLGNHRNRRTRLSSYPIRKSPRSSRGSH